MRIITPAKLAIFVASRPDRAEAERARRALAAWRDRAELGEWRTFADLRAVFPSADQVGSCVVFNVGGNRYRLVAVVLYERVVPRRNPAIPGEVRQPGAVLVRRIMTHREYDEPSWIAECGCDQPRGADHATR